MFLLTVILRQQQHQQKQQKQQKQQQQQMPKVATRLSAGKAVAIISTNKASAGQLRDKLAALPTSLLTSASGIDVNTVAMLLATHYLASVLASIWPFVASGAHLFAIYVLSRVLPAVIK